MKYQLNKEFFITLKNGVRAKAKLIFDRVVLFYEKSPNQAALRISCCVLVTLIAIAFVVILAKLQPIDANPHQPEFADQQFESTIKRDISKSTPNDQKLAEQLGDLKSQTDRQFDLMKEELHAIQSDLRTLASSQDVQQLQSEVATPNQALLGKVNDLQNSMQKIIKETAKETWLDPKSVEKYFKLIAIQGFSDGMRAIIDIDGNETALDLHQLCPACRGWVLHKMDYTHQTAVFYKEVADRKLYVKLQSN